MSNEDWKTWPEPTAPSVVVWRDKGAGLSTATRSNGGRWYAAGISYGRTWSELLAYIDTYGDGTPPRIVPLDEPEPEPEPKPETITPWWHRLV